MSEVIDRRSTDEIVDYVCRELNVERVEIRRPERTVECATCNETFLDGRCPNACADVGNEVRPAQQVVYTSDAHYYGNDRLDVSPGSADPVGGWFAPSRQIAETLTCAHRYDRHGVTLADAYWHSFSEEYTAEMRVRFGIVPQSEHWTSIDRDSQRAVHSALSRGVEPTPTAWDALLAMREVTLVCTCADSTRCHRVLLARILEKLGATYAGEVR